MFVLLPKSLVAAVHAERVRYHPLETGGFLIGLRRGRHIEVTGLTPQAQSDIATRTGFERIDGMHRDLIHAAWRNSSGVETLVGDWHSHPHGPGVPSSTDLSAWRALTDSVRRPVLGLIDSGRKMPSLYLTAGWGTPRSVALKLCEDSLNHLAFAEAL